MIFRIAVLVAIVNLAACVTGSVTSETGAFPRLESHAGEIRKDYVDGRFGQLHIHAIAPSIAVEDRKTPLILFHPNPVSGNFYRDFMLEMGKDRVVMAIDTPGYGQSARPPEPQSIGGLAGAAADALDALGYGRDGNGAIDVLGYHTGTLIAAELAITRRDLVRRLVLPGIPFYMGQERVENYERLTSPEALQEDGSHVLDAWEFWVTDRNEGVSLERGAEHFADQLQSGTTSWWAYHSVFSYAAEERLPLVTQPVMIPNTHGGLMEHSRAAAALFPNVKLIDMPNLHHGIFDVGVDELAATSREFLD